MYGHQERTSCGKDVNAVTDLRGGGVPTMDKISLILLGFPENLIIVLSISVGKLPIVHI